MACTAVFELANELQPLWIARELQIGDFAFTAHRLDNHINGDYIPVAEENQLLSLVRLSGRWTLLYEERRRINSGRSSNRNIGCHTNESFLARGDRQIRRAELEP